jgi:hypothetical protein
MSVELVTGAGGACSRAGMGSAGGSGRGTSTAVRSGKSRSSSIAPSVLAIVAATERAG